MDQDMLDSLIGLNVAEAKKQIKDAGLKAEVYSHNSVITSQARPKTIILCHRGGEVINAIAGDPLELK